MAPAHAKGHNVLFDMSSLEPTAVKWGQRGSPHTCLQTSTTWQLTHVPKAIDVSQALWPLYIAFVIFSILSKVLPLWRRSTLRQYQRIANQGRSNTLGQSRSPRPPCDLATNLGCPLNLYFCLYSLPLWALTNYLSFQWNEMKCKETLCFLEKKHFFLSFRCLDPSYADAWCKLKIYMLVYIIKHPLLKSTWTMFENTNKNEWEYSMVWLCAILSIFYWSNLWSKLNFKMLLVYIVLGLLVSGVVDHHATKLFLWRCIWKFVVSRDTPTTLWTHMHMHVTKHIIIISYAWLNRFRINEIIINISQLMKQLS
jgi:hypothetical protein